MILKNILDIKLIDLNLNANNKDEVIQILSQKLYDYQKIDDLAEFQKAVYEREKIGETGMGNQIAIPHGLSQHVLIPSVAIAKTKNPIKWESLDNLPVKLIFLLAAPTDKAQQTHLQMLAQLAAILAYQKHIDELLKCQNEQEFYELFSKYLNERLKNKENGEQND